MGKEFVVDSLEDMCALMCDNNTERLEERKMADIELVIKIHDIPKNDHERWVLEHGTPLPKGHKIIDATALQEHLALVPMEDRTFRETVDIIDWFPSIIEADKGDKE